MNKEKANKLIVLAVYILLAVMVLLAITFFSNLKLLKSDPCLACEELIGETCVLLIEGTIEQQFEFDDTKPKTQGVEVNYETVDSD